MRSGQRDLARVLVGVAAAADHGGDEAGGHAAAVVQGVGVVVGDDGRVAGDVGGGELDEAQLRGEAAEQRIMMRATIAGRRIGLTERGAGEDEAAHVVVSGRGRRAVA